MWARLQEENAPFRIVTPDGLASAAEDVFDPMILSHVTKDWQPAVRVAGNILGQRFNEPYFQCGDIVLWKRLRALVNAGAVEGRGNMVAMRGSEVRRVG